MVCFNHKFQLRRCANTSNSRGFDSPLREHQLACKNTFFGDFFGAPGGGRDFGLSGDPTFLVTLLTVSDNGGPGVPGSPDFVTTPPWVACIRLMIMTRKQS
jgi:hypothetical protein